MNIAFTLLILTFTSQLVFADTQANTCAASVTTTPRSSWNQNGLYYQMYDLVIRNTGSCTITSLHVNIAHPAGTDIGNPTYNYDASTGEISNFGGAIAPGQSFSGSGFTVSGSSASLSQSALTVSVTQQACSNCATSAPAQPTGTTAPASKPATKAPTTAPTKVPSLAPTPGPTTPATAAPTIRPSDYCYGRCTTSEVCADLNNFYGNQCYPQSCQAVTCRTGEVCIGDGGVARCIVTNSSAVEATAAPTPFPSTDLCNGMCTKGEVCVNLNQTLGPQCFLQMCAGLSCPEGTRCMNNGGVAQCIHTQSRKSEIPIEIAAAASVQLPPPAAVVSDNDVVASPVSVDASFEFAPLSSCVASVSAVPRARSAHVQENGLVAQIWDLVISNENSATPYQVEVDISVPSESFVTQTWNLERSAGRDSTRFSVTTHNVLAHNPKFFAAGFVVSGSGTPSVSVSDVKCRA